MNTRKEDQLPDLLSDLIEVALVDLEKVEASRCHRIDMNVWHHPNSETGKCSVCFAGGVIAFTLGSDPTVKVIPNDFSKATLRKLAALDWVRLDDVNWALRIFHDNEPPGSSLFAKSDWPSIPFYAADPDRFKAALADVVTALRERGL